MEVRVWLSYDLGVKGDYPGLYAWLDDHDAIECGESFCSFLFECSDRDKLKPELLAAIQKSVELSPTDRIYVIYRRNDDLAYGSFLWGRRKANPWEGYVSLDEHEEVTVQINQVAALLSGMRRKILGENSLIH